ncbi:hypothetical protein CAI21_01365 [Alkalilimnicola ehrlichii]|uniref:Purine nucleoside phosphorylase n=1 Tax=Alkalilimnicola ehrlichii TaxID=351052 RepID=A0A3E0X310_9GAMM|nr:peptidoglycan editing factor PgeF [Alkalilimnicola ehrlichii]RFA31309.1 hypothetical protein CAI21_01365 [Alkalilimnicola ehrlichii]RFA39418.1 hypothetical protein CAL65_01045 [Alkalilimnicola ehrlichii]
MTESASFIAADWPAPTNIKAGVTTRVGGASLPPLASFNLGINVEDDPVCLAENRRRLRERLRLPQEPAWLRQVHGTRVVPAADGEAEADGSWADRPGIVCAVLTADCLPVLLCDDAGERVAALHAGWRGLAAGIIEQGVAALQTAPATLMAWLGPAIGPAVFEVGGEVRAAFLRQSPAAAECFVPADREGHWYADLYGLARERLQRLGIDRVYGGGFCTYRQKDMFYSYRRDGRTGRMASLIWR